MAAQTRIRDIARNAIRDELAQVALDRFRRDGFDNVTFDDLAAAAGVSRSTVLRYFGSKEEVVLGVFGPLSDEMSQALVDRPLDENDWTALRRSLDPVVEYLTRNLTETIDLLRLIHATPALCTGLREKSVTWHPVLTEVLTQRGSETPVVIAHVRVAAALDCLTIALNVWADSDGRLALTDILDEAFTALTQQ
ncbi:TetR family transcriptional regulator [Streptomyces sp. NPDC087856]|uniref:TetR family transcriptional regulator n=1 Tax=Streptomyces sp. NPDC087856 TaxID=3365811 RepID=UPI003814E806